jgi:hypothetical protein
MTVTADRESRVVVSNAGFANPIPLDQFVKSSLHLRVYADEAELTEGVDYSVAGILDPDGVEVTILSPGLAIAPTVWVVEHRPPVEQGSDLSLGGRFGLAYEQALDDVVRMLQSFQDRLDRGVRLSVTAPPGVDAGQLPPPVANNLVGWNATATGMENKGTVPQLQIVATYIVEVVNVSVNMASVLAVEANESDISTVASDIANVSAVGANIAAVQTVNTNMASILAVEANESDISTVAANVADVSAVGANIAAVQTVATDIADVNAVATDIADVSTAAANIAAIQAAPGAASSAAGSASLAGKWATEAEDVVVTGGLYSAYHWAQKAASVVTGGVATAIHAADGKATPVDADELGLADSAASWSLKKLTWANLKATLASTFLPLTGGTMTGPLVLPASTTAAPSLHIEPGIDPTAPANGDVWFAGAGSGLRLHRDGSTVGLWDSASLSLIPKAEAEAGTSTTNRLWSAERVAQAIAALTPPAPVGLYTGSDKDETVFPVGHHLWVFASDTNRNGTVVPYTHGVNAREYTGGSGAIAIAGTWRSRGQSGATGNENLLAQRVA